jgi:hypothetical protein
VADDRLIERVESVAAFRLPSVPSKLGVASRAPDFGGNVPLHLQYLFAFCYRPPKQKRPLDLPPGPAPLRLVKNETNRIRSGAVREGGLEARRLASR